MDTPISRAEHEEFRRRMEDEHKRMNHRLGDLEETVRQIGELTASVQSLAQSVEQMAQSQSRQETRLEELESRDGEMWRKVVGYVLTAVISVTVGFIFSQNCVLKVSVDTKKWLKAAGIRAVKTMAQTAVAVIGTGAVISAVDWQMVVSSAVVAGVVSVLTSVAGIPEVAEGK